MPEDADAVVDGVAAEAEVVALAVVAGVVVLAVLAAAVLAAAAVFDFRPITCSSDCSSVPNRFCVAPAGACVEASLPELSVDSTCEPCLWPCR